MPNDRVGSGEVVACQKQSIPARIEMMGGKRRKKADLRGHRLFKVSLAFESLHVFSLPALRTFCEFELHLLAFLQASESARLDGRVMDENVWSVIAANEPVTFGVVEPLYCSLF